MTKKAADEGNRSATMAEASELRSRRRAIKASTTESLESLERQAKATDNEAEREVIDQQIRDLDRVQRLFSAAGMRLETLLYPDLDGQPTALRSILSHRKDYQPKAEEYASLLHAVDNGIYLDQLEALHARAALVFLLERHPPAIQAIRELAYAAGSNESAELRAYAREAANAEGDE